MPQTLTFTGQMTQSLAMTCRTL